MKWLFKWLLRLLLLLAVLAVLLFLSKDSILRSVAEKRIRDATGMEVKIERFSSRLFSPAVTIENLKLFNTSEFGGGSFLTIPELHIEVDRAALISRKLRITLARFNVAELSVVKNEAGITNLFNIANKMKGAKTGGSWKWLGDFQFEGIDVLNLTLGKAKFIDLKDRRNDRELYVNMRNQVFKGVKSEADLGGIAFMAWLRSGGNIPPKPGDPAPALSNGKTNRPATNAPVKK